MESLDPKALARDLQLRTRREMKFDEFEAGLPDPKSHIMPALADFTIGGIVKKIGDLNPFGKIVSKDDTIWLLDNTAYRSARLKSWEVEYVAAVFERDPHCKVADVVSSIAGTLGLADDAAERATIEERILPFLWDIRMVRIVKLSIQGKDLKMTPTNINGISTEVMKVPSADAASWVTSSVNAPQGANGILDAQTFYAGPEGWGVLSGE